MEWDKLKDIVYNNYCPKCRRGRLVPQRLNTDGKSINFTCDLCRWFDWIRLPPIEKKILYLDNGVLANIVKAQKRVENDNPFQRLFQSLRRGVESEVVTCPLSPITRAEYEFRGKEGFEQSHKLALGLGKDELRSHYDIQDEQLKRVLDDYLDNKPASTNRTPPLSDAFRANLNSWTDIIRWNLNDRTAQDLIEKRRANKSVIYDGLNEVLENYKINEMKFGDIVQEELRGFGRSILAAHQHALSQWDTNPLGLMTTFTLLIQYLSDSRNLNINQARHLVEKFLQSEHVYSTPYADINAKMFARIIWGAIQTKPRELKKSDAIDVDHIATYLPYVDVMVVDKNMKNFATTNPVSLQDHYKTQLFGSSHDDIIKLAEHVDGWIEQKPETALIRQVKHMMFREQLKRLRHL